MRAITLMCVCVCAVAAWSVALPPVFGDNAVLQAEMAVPVWGTADAGEAVTVAIDDAKVAATADAAGRWRVVLPAHKAGGPYTLTVTGAKGAASAQNVLFGEVWFCSGQSNMQYTLDRAANGKEAAANADFPTMRMFQANTQMAFEPQTTVKGQWVVCTPATAPKYSAVGFFFGRELLANRKTPVGLIHVSQGWTPGEAWMSREALLADPDLKIIVDRWDEIIRDAKAYQDAMKTWQALADQAKKDGVAPPAQPVKPKADPNFLHRASGYWNGGVAPLAGYGIRGIIWYQGETNEVRAHQYRKEFSALIRSWRQAWGQGDLPFLFVQVAPVLPPDPQPVESEWAELREAQAMALALPNTGMAVTVDIGEEKDVHPKAKAEVGYRLSLLARALVYKEDIPCYGPLYESMAVEGKKIRLRFSHVDGGLRCLFGEVRGFAIAGADRKFVPAKVTIEKDNTVLVESDAVPNPVAVRYAWANNPMPVNLVNGLNLPTAPFRTDDWPGKTVGFTKMTVDLF
jgi:sialate O-acetylesterase